jgi:EpsI family protein
MSPTRRAALGVAFLTVGLAAQAALERVTQTPRPPLKQPLATLPLQLGDWEGRDEPIAPEILERSQADDYLNRVYEDRNQPGRRLVLWVNYSRHGLNLRHSPEICLPSGGWTKIESQTQVVSVPRGGAEPVLMTRLGYSKDELVQQIGFWYYIFGEGRLEHFVRTLRITSRSSHGRTTRGSGLTVEVFSPGDSDPEAQTLRDFAAVVLEALEPILPEERAEYFIP